MALAVTHLCVSSYCITPPLSLSLSLLKTPVIATFPKWKSMRPPITRIAQPKRGAARPVITDKSVDWI